MRGIRAKVHHVQLAPLELANTHKPIDWRVIVGQKNRAGLGDPRFGNEDNTESLLLAPS